MIREPRPPLAGRPIVISRNSDHLGAVVGFRYQRLGGVKGCGLQFKFFGLGIQCD